MANVELKKDFKDGQFLYGDDLNNNFKVIEAGINDNEDNLQGVIKQAQEELRNELEEITGERGWDWNDGSAERVTFYKGNTEQVNAKEVSNGQLLYDTTTGETALDTGGKRVMTGAGNILAVSEEEPTNTGTKVWINPDKIVKQPASNVVDSLKGNETNLAPSVRAVKEMQSNIENAIKQTYSTKEQVIGTWTDGKPVYRQTILGNVNNEQVLKENVDTLVDAYGTVYMNANTRPINYFEYYNNHQYFWNVRLNANKLYMACLVADEPYNPTDAKITLEYTKTTD